MTVKDIKLFTTNDGSTIILGNRDGYTTIGISIHSNNDIIGKFSTTWNTRIFEPHNEIFELKIDPSICILYSNNILVLKESEYCIDLNKGVIRAIKKEDFYGVELSKEKVIKINYNGCI
jgi:hypothetical protein